MSDNWLEIFSPCFISCYLVEKELILINSGIAQPCPIGTYNENTGETLRDSCTDCDRCVNLNYFLRKLFLLHKTIEIDF